MTTNDKGEILTAINSFASHMEERFNGVEGRLTSVEDRVRNMENNMVTKWYLDDKLADLKRELVPAIKRVNIKADTLTGILGHKQVISSSEVQTVLNIQPFGD